MGGNYLTFASAEAFTIAIKKKVKTWDGSLYYSTDTSSWFEWDGTTEIESAEHDGGQRIYMRGVGNTVIMPNPTWTDRLILTGNAIHCRGNIENLLDYATVENGEHPAMGDSCFFNLFADCTSLVEAPALPATTLAVDCYRGMFVNCTSLVKAPSLPATVLTYGCYSSMFIGCTSLVSLPILPATTLATYCYYRMFEGCESLVSLPILPATTLTNYSYGRMFADCTNIKLSEVSTEEFGTLYRIPFDGTGSMETNALDGMFAKTGGTFTGTPSINITYYTSNKVVYPEEPAPSIDPSALLMGYRVGQLIRIIRGKVVEPEEIIEATFTDGVLYIKKAPAIFTDGILEVE